MNLYSENEITFFKQLLIEYDERIDGRDKMEIRNYRIESNVINNCFSSIKITYNNSKNEMIFAVKGELLKDENKEGKSSTSMSDNLINISINSLNYKISEEYKITKTQIEFLLNKLMIEKIPVEPLIINSIGLKLFWKIHLDIYIFDELRMSLFQLISIGVKEVLLQIKIPKLIVFKNEISQTFEYDLETNYKDISKEESEQSINLKIPNIYSFTIMNNSFYLDPSDEELIITSCNLYLSELNKNILDIESIGDSVNPILYSQISNIIKNFN